MRRLLRRYDLRDEDREKLDFVFSVYGPGMKDASLASKAFIARYNKTHGLPIRGGHGSLARRDPSYADISFIENVLMLPDVIGGMGFGEFLSVGFRQRFVDTGTFEDFPYPAMPSPMFGGVDMVDASGSYHIYGGSCFGFLVDTRKLEGKPVPRMWSDVLDPLYRDMVVCGFNIDDINDIVLLNIFRFFGTPGLEAFARNLAAPVDTLDMMRTSLRARNRHAIFILPCFFGAAAPHEEWLVHVWPDDGAFLAPYYLMARNTGTPKVQAILNFFFGRELEGALTGKKMLHINAREVDPALEGRRLKWVGWDWLLERDIIDVMREIDDVVVPLVLEKHPKLAADLGKALWNG